MAANNFNVIAAHDGARISLHGDMGVVFDQAVSRNFTVGFHTTTSDFYNFSTTTFNFRDTNGALVNGLLFGGRPGLFIEMMFDPDERIWYVTANNMISGASDNAGQDRTEKTLVGVPIPALTPINYLEGCNYRMLMNGDFKLQNPTNMKPGDKLRIVIEQDLVGGRKLTYDGAYGWQEAVIPLISTVPQYVDIFEAYMTADYTLQCNLYKNYSVVRPLAYSGEFKYTVQSAYDTAMANPVKGQTVQILRDGWRTEVNGTIGFQKLDTVLRVKGVVKPNGQFPVLKLAKEDRPSFGKALVNIEGGTVVVEDLSIQGASAYADGNGTGILINGQVDYVLIKNVHLKENENGVRSGVSHKPRFDLVNVYLEGNGWAANPAHVGYSHSIYAGDADIWRGHQTTFYNPVGGHNIKTRALSTVLKQVYSRKSNGAREIDCPDQGIMHVYDSVFWKEADAQQNNLIGIGHELLDGFGRYQEYYFYNCYFHNDVDPNREVTFLENRSRGATPNTVKVHFIDCEWGGRALNANNKGSTMQGPYAIYKTGGPLGPRVVVGSTHKPFDMAERDPNRSSNPASIAETPIGQLPPLTPQQEMPPYPTFLPLETIPPLPSFGSGGGGGTTPPPGGGTTPPPPPAPDTTKPVVALASSSMSVVAAGSITLTATATDNKAVTKVEFNRNGVKFATATAAPYTAMQNFTEADNGTVSYTATAFDAAGNNDTSAATVVTVNIPVTPPPPPPPLDTTPPVVSLASSTTNVTQVTQVTLTATATDDRGVARVEFSRNGETFATDTVEPYIAAQTMGQEDNGTVQYAATAFDAAGNLVSSNTVTVTVNIPPPPVGAEMTTDATTTAAVQTAIDGSVSGPDFLGKRLAAAQAIVDAFEPSHTMKIYREGVVIFNVTFSGTMSVYQEDVVENPDVGVYLGDAAGGVATQNADINTGVWTFQVSGGPSGQALMNGTVGPVGSNANIVLGSSPIAGEQFDAVVTFILDPSIDGLAG